MSTLTSKQKLDSLLGISDDQSIDSFLDQLSQDTQQISSAFNDIDKAVEDNLQAIDTNLAKVEQDPSTAVLALKDMNTSMKEIEELIGLSKKMFKHIYENICSSDLLDSELISSAAKMLESIHINISEFISMYRDKQSFIDKVKIMVFQQQQKKELMLLKHDLDLERIKAAKKDEKVVDAENMHEYSQEYFVKLLAGLDNKNNAE